ncbi:MAG: hypothetical protein FWH04_05425 [Oscillospiraceae bacterium]|nr:hypothetical protein [Oscillospiraceae bacterium]
MQWIPNVHLLGLFIATFTLTYRVRALIPIYVYILLEGALSGFAIWWIPYLYIWLPLWAVFMLAGRLRLEITKNIKTLIYMSLCAFHGLLFGVLYAPFQALMLGLSLDGMMAWIISGLPFDIIHAVCNFSAGALVAPLSALLKKLYAGTIR